MSKSPAAASVSTPSVATPNSARASSSVTARPMTPIDPVMVVGEAQISSAVAEIQ